MIRTYAMRPRPGSDAIGSLVTNNEGIASDHYRRGGDVGVMWGKESESTGDGIAREWSLREYPDHGQDCSYKALTSDVFDIVDGVATPKGRVLS